MTPASEFDLIPLPSGIQYYNGPDAQQQDRFPCQCNTVVYSLMSACGACQGASWLTYASDLTPRKIHADDILPDGTHGQPSVPILVWFSRGRCASTSDTTIPDISSSLFSLPPSETSVTDIRDQFLAGRPYLTGRILTWLCVSLPSMCLVIFRR